MAHSHDHHHPSQETGNIKVAFFLNLAFTLIEIVGGIWTNSVAIISDAIHDLGDSLSLGLSWYFQKLAGKGQDQRFSFGYQRFSLLGAVVNGLVLIIGSILVLQEAIPRLWDPESPQTEGMIGLAVIGVLVNGAAVLRLRRGRSINARAVGLHLLEDVLGWVAVLIAAIVMRFFSVPILDPLLSVAITLWVLYNVFRNLRESFRIFLQAVPTDRDMAHIRQQIEALPSVEDVHDIHLWTLDGEYDIFTAHLRSSTNRPEKLRQQVRQLLSDYEVEHCTIQIEASGHPCQEEQAHQHQRRQPGKT